MHKFYSFLTGLLCCSLLATGCAQKEKKPDTLTEDQAYIEYISEYTTGTISRAESITVRLARNADLTDFTPGKKMEAAEELLHIRPAIKGKMFWEDKRTLTFYPDQVLPSDTDYTATLKLAPLFEVPEDLEEFTWGFRTRTQGFDVKINETLFTESAGEKFQQIKGTLETHDWCEIEKLEKVFSLSGIDDLPPITWEHGPGENIHTFLISGLKRKEKSYNFTLEWNGSAIGVNKKGNRKLEVFGTDEFRFINYKLEKEPEIVLKVQFSVAPAPNQDFSSLITITGDSNPRYLCENNTILIYPSGKHDNTIQITIHKGLKDRGGTILGEETEFTITFQQEKPQLRWGYKTGGILPDSDKIYLPFEAISLRAVDVTIVEVYESNIVQFLQVNKNLTGINQLKRVGRPVLYTTLELDKVARNLYEWNQFQIDLAEIIKLKPGSLYQVRLNFRRSQSVYSCNESVEGIANDEFYKESWDATNTNESSYWDYYDSYYYYGEDYWKNRDNPCRDEYYGKRRQISQNVLASNLGILARGSRNDELSIYVSDIISTEPLSGVEVTVYNYQQRELARAKTNASGHVSFHLTQQPFALIAAQGEQRGYLRLDEDSALPLSGFDIGGTDSARGIKGFLYGERGVWRPGDTIYLNFILEDKQNIIPPDHPLIFELRDPKGMLANRIVSTNGVGGIYNFTTSTEPEDVTGNWKAVVRVGGEQFEKTLKIETVKPNRLKINLDFGTDVLKPANSLINANLEVKWLHGAVARDLKAEFDLMLRPLGTTFPKYRNYTFDDPTRMHFSSSQNIFTGKLDNEGKATFPVNIGKTRDAPGVLKASFAGKVFEEGGNFSIDKIDIPYYPYSSYTGIKIPQGDKARGMLLTDEDHKVQIVTLDSDGQPTSRNGLEVELYKLSWKWWWDKSSENTANFLRKNYLEKNATARIDTRDGQGEYTLRINYPDWGRYFLRVTDPSSGHSTGKIFYIDWPGWAGTAQREGMGGATMLSFYTDKSEYETGDTVTVTIPGGAEGRALLSLETGSRIVDSYWVETKQGLNTFTFKTTPAMSPNVYIHITLLQPHDQVDNDLPLRLYGIFPIKVVDPATRLNPQLKVPDTLAPEKEVVLHVSEANRREMAYTVAVVDEGLLDLTRFSTPDAWAAMYRKEALGITAWDLYDQVLGAMNEKFGHLLTIGGGDDIIPPQDQKANRFEPVVKFFGPYFLQEGREATHKFTMPRYVGAVKTMIVAANREGAYGLAEQSSFVKESLMVLGTMPRVLGPGEKIKLPVNLFVLDEAIKEVEVKVNTTGPLQAVSQKTARLLFSEPGDQFVYFDLETPSELGVAKVMIEATAGAEKATYEIEIDVRPSNPMETEVITQILEAGTTWEQQVTLKGLEGTNSQTLEASYLPPINLDKRLNYLLNFPHGCIEQTTSAVFPQLYLDKLTDLNQQQRDRMTNNINAGIQRLKKFQTNEGGFAYWPGNSASSPWGTSYAGHFLCEAGNLGYNIPVGLLSSWADYQRREANKWRRDDKYSNRELVQAYRLFTLALHGTPELGAMNRMREESGLDPRARWRLAAAYALTGKTDTARDIIAGQSTEVKEYSATSVTYGSAQRDKAMILETISYLDNPIEGYPLLRELATELGSKRWFSTQSTAYTLLAIARFNIVDDDQTHITCHFAHGTQSGDLVSDKSLLTKDLEPAAGMLKVTNTGGQPLFVSFISRGIPLQGEESEDQRNLRLEVTYKTKDGKIVSDPGSLPQGTDLLIESRITNTGVLGDLEELALTQLVPPGWEILNARLQGLEDYSQYDKPEYLDIRDDRVYTYFDLKSGQTRTFGFIINVAYPGEYYLPGTTCEAMYNNQAYARLKGRPIAIAQ